MYRSTVSRSSLDENAKSVELVCVCIRAKISYGYKVIPVGNDLPDNLL